MQHTGERAGRGPRWLAVFLLGAVIVLAGAMLGSAPAYAADCAPSPTTACVQGTMKTSAGDPATGVTIDLEGADGPQSTRTDDTGHWSFVVEKAGDYTVSADESTLPEGQAFKKAGSRDIEVTLYDATSVLFPLAEGTGGAGDDAAPSPGADAQQPDADGTVEDGTVEDGATDDGEDADDASASNPNQVEAQTGSQAGTTSTEAGGDGFSWPRFWQQLASGVRMGLLLALGAVGLSLVFGTTGLSNFSHAEMLSMGGILAYLFMQLTGNIWIAGAVAVVIMAAFGWLQDAVLWKPLRKRRLSLMQMMIVTIGFSIVLQNIFQFFFGANILRIDPSTPPTLTVFGVTLTVQSYIAMAIALVVIIAVSLAMKYSRFGRATRAVADNRALAEASGIDVDRVIRSVWTIGVGLAGLSGVLLGLVLNGIGWNTGWQFLLLLFAAVILGGIGTAFGAIVGAMIIGIIVEMANIWLPGDLKHAAALFILIVVLLVRPQGLLGRRERIG